MILIILTAALLIAAVIFYSTPILGTVICLLGVILAIYHLRRSRVLFGILALVLSGVTLVLSILILLMTLHIMEPFTDINIGYSVEKTKEFNTMLVGDIKLEQERIKNNINEYLRKRMADLANGTKTDTIYPELFMDSSDIVIQHSTSTLPNLKDEITDQLYTDIVPFMAVSDSTVDYYLINLDKLESTISTMDKVKKDKRYFWLMDKEGNVYLNVKNMEEYRNGRK